MFVSISFCILRKKAPDMKRPYVVKNGMFVGVMAVILSGIMVSLYIIPIPFASSALSLQEWIVVGTWSALGLIFYLYSKKKYGAEFGSHLDIELDDEEEIA